MLPTYGGVKILLLLLHLLDISSLVESPILMTRRHGVLGTRQGPHYFCKGVKSQKNLRVSAVESAVSLQLMERKF